MTFWPKIGAKDVSKECMVICEEIKMYRDLPQYYVYELLDGLVWPDHPLGKSLAGTEQTVSSMTSKDLKTFHQTYYQPDNIVVAVCGKLNHKKVVSLVKKKLGKIKSEGEKKYLSVNNSQSCARANYHHRESEQMHLALGCEAYDQNHKDRYKLTILSAILGGNMSSRLFNEVREKRGLAYSISASSKSLHDTGLFLVRAGVDNTKIVDAVDVVLKEFTKIKRNGVKEDEFLRFRDYILGQLMLSLEDTMDHMLWIGESLTNKDDVKPLKKIIADFKKIKPEDMKQVACDILDPKRFNLAVVGPITPVQQKELDRLLHIKS